MEHLKFNLSKNDGKFKIMKSDAVFSNAAPTADENTAVVSIAKTTEGELCNISNCCYYKQQNS